MRNFGDDVRRFAHAAMMSAFLVLSAASLTAQSVPPGIPTNVPSMDPSRRNDRDPFPRLDPRVEELRRQRAATDRLSHLRSDSVRLVELCNQLKTSLNDHPNLPTEADRKLMQDIEKLAKNIRSRMTE